MPQVLQAKCPGCNKVLRIPADWVNQSIRCKHCGMIVQVKSKPAPANAAEPLAPIPQAATAQDDKLSFSTGEDNR